MEADEVAFLDGLRDEELSRDRATRAAEEAALLQFREARAAPSAADATATAERLAEARSSAPLRPSLPIKKKVVPKSVLRCAVRGSHAKPSTTHTSVVAPAVASDAAPSVQQPQIGGLGLLGAYGSDDDDDDTSDSASDSA